MMYLVRKMLTEDCFSVKGFPLGVKFEDDIIGYLPVYKTYEDAMKHAKDKAFVLEITESVEEQK